MTVICQRDPRYWEPKYEHKSVFFKECAVAGTSFHIESNDDIWHELEEGTQIALVRDKANKHDSNAVAVVLADDYNGDPDDFDFDFILGYIPRNDNEEIARLLDAGYDDKLTAKITTYRNHGNVNNRIRITIYLESLKPLLNRPNLLRADTIDLNTLRLIDEELKEKGTVYRRYGGFYDDLRKINPIVGEKVVTLYDGDPEFIVLYLLRILSTGNNCEQYVEYPDSLVMVDDCCPYILTNVCGPVLINRKESSFLSELDISDLDPMEYLNECLSKNFERLFKKVLLWPLNRNNIDMDPSLDDPKDAE